MADGPELHEVHLRAARCWYATLQGHLRSAYVDFLWPGPTVQNEEPPAKNPWADTGWGPNAGWRGPLMDREPEPRWGFYALTLEAARNRLREELGNMAGQNARWSHLPPVLGRVELFGTVWVHEHGYRAQGMVVARLAVLQVERASVDCWETLADRLADRYRCDVNLVSPQGAIG